MGVTLSSLPLPGLIAGSLRATNCGFKRGAVVNLTPMQGSLSKGGFPLPRKFNVRTCEKIYVRKKIGAMFERYG